MTLEEVTFKDKKLFDRYLRQRPCLLSQYAFENIILWQPILKVYRRQIGGCLCVFFKDPFGYFMPLPPLGKPDLKTVESCFEVMEGFNRNTDISRIENIDEAGLAFYKTNKFRSYEKAKEYIVPAALMAELKGEAFKHKRNLVNFFKKHRSSRLRRYEPRDEPRVLDLYTRWASGRKEANRDPVYQGMLEDSQKVLAYELRSLKLLDIEARVVECDGSIAAFTSGFPLSPGLFCINFEIADLGMRGLAQFVFAEFCKELSSYDSINIMDDSGIANLSKTKLSYKPSKIVSSYTALLPQ